MKRLWITILIMCSLANLFAQTAPAWAHGGGALQLSNAPAGPYLVSVWMQTDRLRVGTVHITVAVSQSAADGDNVAGEPVLGALVRVTAQPLSAGSTTPPIEKLATSDNAANKLYYETDLEATQPGLWHFALEVTGPAGGGVVSFEKELQPAVNVGWPVWAGIIGVILLAAWLAQSRARPGTTSARPPRPAQMGGR